MLLKFLQLKISKTRSKEQRIFKKVKKPDKTDFKLKMIDEKEGNYIIIKGSIHQEDVIM